MANGYRGMMADPRNAGGTDDVVTLRSLLGLVRRRFWTVTLITLLVLGLAAAAAFLLPPRYAAESLLVYEPAAADDRSGYGQPTSVQSHLSGISEILFRRDLLEKEIREHDLLPEAVPPFSKVQLEEVKSRIGIRAEGESTFSISFRGDDPERVTQVVTHLADALVETSRSQRTDRAEDRSEFLRQQLEPLVAELRAQEQEIEGYKQRWAAEMPEQAPTNLRLLEGVQERLLEASSEVADAEARRAAIQREMSELERQGINNRKNPAELRLDTLRDELADLRLRYTDRHPDVMRLQARISDLEADIAAGRVPQEQRSEPTPTELRYLALRAELEEVEQKLESARRQRSTLMGDSGAYQSRIEAALRHESALASMEAEATTLRERVGELRKQLQEAELAQQLSVTEQGAVFRVVEAARVPSTPVSPNRTRILLMGLVAGLGLGGLAAFAREQLDSSFRNVDEIEAATGLRVLAGIPALERARGRSGGTRTDLPIIEEPSGIAAEQFRMLATRIFRRKGAGSSTSTLITSAMAGEGKTTTAVNLAIALAEMTGEEVLLVDADVARASAYRFLGVSRGNGLAHLLQNPDEDPARHARWRHGASLLEVGPFSPETRSALASPRGERVFQKLRQRYRHVVVDSPPVLGAPEALVLQTMVDDVVVVVRAGSTPRDAVKRTCQILDSNRLIGVVLNGAAETQVYAYGYLQPATAEEQRA